MPEKSDEKEFIDVDKIKDSIDDRFDEYKKFAFKGDMMKMAIAFILGGAFSKVVTSISESLIMPFLNFILLKTGVGWREFAWTPWTGLTLEVGQLLAAFVDFFLISIVLFIMWKILKRMKQ